MREKRFLITAICIYLAYFTHGMQAIVISQLREQFAVQWSTDLAGVMGIIAWTGLAKFLSVWVCGEISDRIGRKPMVIIGAVSYVVFFTGLLLSTNYTVAAICAFLAGAATSCWDGSCYPALQESFPKAPGSALVALKGFVSLSGMLYPLFIGYLVTTGASWGLAIWTPLACSVLVLALGFMAPFSYDEEIKENRANKKAGKEVKAAPAPELGLVVGKTKFAVEGTCCLIYGFIAMMTFYLIQQCITIYGKDVIGMSEMASRALMTYYTAGSIAAVIIGATIMAKGVRPIGLLIVYTCGSLVSLLLMYYVRVEAVTMVTSFAIGFCAAGGALQSGLAVFGEFFPNKKGRNLGMYYTFMGLASYLGPVIAGWFLRRQTEGLDAQSTAYVIAEAVGKSHIILFDGAIAAAGFVLMLVVGFRYKQVFGVSPFTRKK